MTECLCDEKQYEKVTLESGQTLHGVHTDGECRGPWCVIHKPSYHLMRDWPRQWRNDRNMMERVCEHGIGHPDPDDLRFQTSEQGDIDGTLEVHGCDGCCQKTFLVIAPTFHMFTRFCRLNGIHPRDRRVRFVNRAWNVFGYREPLVYEVPGPWLGMPTHLRVDLTMALKAAGARIVPVPEEDA